MTDARTASGHPTIGAAMSVASTDVARGWALAQVSRYADAEALARSAVSRHPDDSDALVLLSFCLRAQGRAEEAVVAARHAAALSPTDDGALTELARSLYAAGREEEAYAVALAALGAHPGSLDALTTLAECAMHVDLAAAEAAAAAVQRAAPASSIGHHLRARVELTRGRWSEAERWSRESLRCNPTSAPEHANRALALDKLGRDDEARAEYQEAVRLDPRRDLPRSNLHIAMRVGRDRGEDPGLPWSVRDIAASLPPAQRARSLMNVIHSHIREGRITAARAAADEARTLIDTLQLTTVEERRTRLLVLDAIAAVDRHGGDASRAWALLAGLEDEARAILRPEERGVFLNNLGLTRLRAGDAAGAIGMLGALAEAERHGGNVNTLARTLLNLGAARAEHGDDAGATAAYTEAMHLADANGHRQRSATIRLNLARVCVRGRDVEGADARVRDARSLLDAAREPMLVAQAEVVSGWVALRRGDLAGGRRLLLTALQSLRRGGERRASDGYAYLAEAAAASGHFTVADIHLHRAAGRAVTNETRQTVARSRAAVDAWRRAAGATVAGAGGPNASGSDVTAPLPAPASPEDTGHSAAHE